MDSNLKLPTATHNRCEDSPMSYYSNRLVGGVPFDDRYLLCNFALVFCKITEKKVVAGGVPSFREAIDRTIVGHICSTFWYICCLWDRIYSLSSNGIKSLSVVGCSDCILFLIIRWQEFVIFAKKNSVYCTTVYTKKNIYVLGWVEQYLSTNIIYKCISKTIVLRLQCHGRPMNQAAFNRGPNWSAIQYIIVVSIFTVSWWVRISKLSQNS